MLGSGQIRSVARIPCGYAPAQVLATLRRDHLAYVYAVIDAAHAVDLDARYPSRPSSSCPSHSRRQQGRQRRRPAALPPGGRDAVGGAHAGRGGVAAAGRLPCALHGLV